METKIKGDKIKEGSIPLSALEDNVKELINSSVGFKRFNGYLSINTPLEIQAYNGIDYYYVKVNDDIIQLNTVHSDETHIPVGPPFSIKYDITEYPKAELSIITDYPEHHKDLKIPVFRGLNTNELFIPDTVIKTTPQTLSDADKNQALANLGIDLIDFVKKSKIIIDFNRTGSFTFEEYGIDIITSNGIFLNAMFSYLNGDSELETVLVDIRNLPDYDNEYSNTNNVNYIGHTYVQYLEDYEKEFGYEINILNKTINIWGV